MLALTTIGLLLPLSSMRTMLGSCTSASAAMWTTAIRALTIMLGVLETDSDLIFGALAPENFWRSYGKSRLSDISFGIRALYIY